MNRFRKYFVARYRRREVEMEFWNFKPGLEVRCGCAATGGEVLGVVEGRKEGRELLFGLEYRNSVYCSIMD
jgi:hypothetical protein